MPVPTFPANVHRYDSCRTFKFHVVIRRPDRDRLSKMGALKGTTEAAKCRNAGDPSYQRNMPGGSTFETVELEQDFSHDPVLEEWVNAVNKTGSSEHDNL